MIIFGTMRQPLPDGHGSVMLIPGFQLLQSHARKAVDGWIYGRTGAVSADKRPPVNPFPSSKE